MADLIFQVRGETLTAYYARQDTEFGRVLNRTATTVSDSDGINGTMIDMGNPNDQNGIIYQGNLNTPQTKGFTIAWSGKFFSVASSAHMMWSFMTWGRFPQNGMECYLWGPTARFSHWQYKNAVAGMDSISSSALTINSNTVYDFVWKWDGTTTANIYLFQDGVTVSAMSSSQGMISSLGADRASLALGYGNEWHQHNYYLRSFDFYEGALSDSSIASFYTGASRSAYKSTAAFNGALSTDPGVANVLSGTSYIINGSTLTGTLTDDAATYTDPGIANVRINTNYIFNDSTLTGTLNAPTASTGTAGTVPINELKEQVRYALFVNNTSTGAPTQNLSENMSRQVGLILKVNPEKIPQDSNYMPCVTVFTDSKSTEPITINQNGLNGKRRAEVNLKVVGIVDEPYTTDLREDPADEDLEILMENIERVLRAYDDLGGNARWQFPTGISYHSAAWDEQAHYRAGILELKVTLDY